MQRFRFPIAVAVTALALVLGLVVIGGLLAGSVLAGGPPWGGQWRGGPPWAGGHGSGHGFALPSELAGLADVPADQRFAHFKDGQPVTIDVTPGTVTAASATSLTIAANDGSTRSFTLDDKTTVRGKQAPSQNDKVVVVTLNGGANAHAVLVLAGDGVGPWGGHTGWGR